MKETGLKEDFCEVSQANLNGLGFAHGKGMLCKIKEQGCHESLRRIKRILIRPFQPLLTMAATFQT
jgi:hypothetical protein